MADAPKGTGKVYYTNADGERVQMDPSDAEALIAGIEASRKKRASDMPEEKAALRTLMDAYERLKDLGWSEAIYCPKDGSLFDAIEAGSTGIHRCYYEGEWPTGSWWIVDGDTFPSRPILFRLDPEAETARKAKAAEAFAPRPTSSRRSSRALRWSGKMVVRGASPPIWKPLRLPWGP